MRDDLAEKLGLRPDDVRVIVPDTGSGYGGQGRSSCGSPHGRPDYDDEGHPDGGMRYR